jgi:RimJ/RimL family protein N-acetyltransferase
MGIKEFLGIKARPQLDRVLQGPRVKVRKFTRKDLDKRCEWQRYENPLYRHHNIYLPTQGMLDYWYKTWVNGRGRISFAIEDEKGRMIGQISLREIDRRGGVTRLGISLAPDAVNKGYGTEALRTFLRCYFNEMAFKRMVLDVAQYNRRAIRCYEKLGFTVTREFLRGNVFNFRIAENKRFSHLRRFFVIDEDREWIKYFDMELTREKFIKEAALKEGEGAKGG